ncbi:MAG: hypothetical protein OEY64_07720 [Nitrospinota bacterium]|nr:hypothetical protein [Nitrospinota bacterium]
MMKSKKFDELKKKVDWLCKELLESKKENGRLERLLLVAEGKIKKMSETGGNGNGNVLDLTNQLEKLKNERKIIKTKVEKMASKLEQFYEE